MLLQKSAKKSLFRVQNSALASPKPEPRLPTSKAHQRGFFHEKSMRRVLEYTLNLAPYSISGLPLIIRLVKFEGVVMLDDGRGRAEPRSRIRRSGRTNSFAAEVLVTGSGSIALGPCWSLIELKFDPTEVVAMLPSPSMIKLIAQLDDVTGLILTYTHIDVGKTSDPLIAWMCSRIPCRWTGPSVCMNAFEGVGHSNDLVMID